jgi:hypothetical protein
MLQAKLAESDQKVAALTEQIRTLQMQKVSFTHALEHAVLGLHLSLSTCLPMSHLCFV